MISSGSSSSAALRTAGVVFLTSRGHRAAKSRAASACSVRDVELVEVTKTVHTDNYSVCGVLKMHDALRRADHQIRREQTRRLMRQAGVRGVQRAQKVFTARPDPAATTPADLVKRDFTAAQPNSLWWSTSPTCGRGKGFAYKAFVTDACTRIIKGWHVAASMRTDDLPLQAFDYAVWQQETDPFGLTHHSDHGSNYL